MVILGESSVPVTAAHPRAVSCETTAWEGRPKIFLCLLSRGPCEKPCAAGKRPDRYTRDDRRRDLWGRAAQLRRRQLDRHSLWRAKSASQETIKSNNNARKIILNRPFSGARQPRDQGPGDIVRNTISLPSYRERPRLCLNIFGIGFHWGQGRIWLRPRAKQARTHRNVRAGTRVMPTVWS